MPKKAPSQVGVSVREHYGVPDGKVLNLKIRPRETEDSLDADLAVRARTIAMVLGLEVINANDRVIVIQDTANRGKVQTREGGRNLVEWLRDISKHLSLKVEKLFVDQLEP